VKNKAVTGTTKDNSITVIRVPELRRSEEMVSDEHIEL
jgi:hypothetical protein